MGSQPIRIQLGKLLREILAGNHCGKILQENLTGKPCRKFLWEILVGKSCRNSSGKILREILAGKSYGKSLWKNFAGNAVGNLVRNVGNVAEKVLMVHNGSKNGKKPPK